MQHTFFKWDTLGNKVGLICSYLKTAHLLTMVWKSPKILQFWSYRKLPGWCIMGASSSRCSMSGNIHWHHNGMTVQSKWNQHHLPADKGIQACSRHLIHLQTIWRNNVHRTHREQTVSLKMEGLSTQWSSRLSFTKILACLVEPPSITCTRLRFSCQLD